MIKKPIKDPDIENKLNGSGHSAPLQSPNPIKPPSKKPNGAPKKRPATIAIILVIQKCIFFFEICKVLIVTNS